MTLRVLDNLDESYEELKQEDTDGLELFDRIPSSRRQRESGLGFVEDLEAKVDRALAADEEEEANLDLLFIAADLAVEDDSLG